MKTRRFIYSRDVVDHGTSFYSWAYRKVMGKQGLGVGNALLGGLAPDQSYYMRLYAENSAGSVWTGKQFLIRTQPKNTSTRSACYVV